MFTYQKNVGRDSIHLSVTGTGVELRAGLGMDPVETPNGIPVTVSDVADGHGGGILAHVPEGDLAAHQTARQTLRVPVVELEGDDRMVRFNREVRGGRVLCNDNVTKS